eukprot:NODE_692_length_1508_cov_96.557916_g570_i0.p1 GENE.NODE_692_length_1508_cov_96.557916_g570_i0~~NODE_692_length_1508_cov_96.557916_g570_i0.p1  ORF type:complete len:257 (+),score=30.18 NODE_692_length_1508_cov_96.557916_g570_i0:677-1447(+)
MRSSANGHNRIYARSLPLDTRLCDDIEADRVTRDLAATTRQLAEMYEWDNNDKVWAFGPVSQGANLLVDMTRGVCNLNEVRDSLVSAWQLSTKEGALCRESTRGIRCDLTDLMLHADAIHRGGGQTIPAARRLYYSCQLSATPRLQEPILQAYIMAPEPNLEGVYVVLSRRQGVVVEESLRPGTNLYCVKAFVPMLETSGLAADLRISTHGSAQVQCVFDHWETCEGDVFDVNSCQGKRVREIRRRKGLCEDLPHS